jgi:hypothetical protein
MTVCRLCLQGAVTYDTYMENELHTFTLCTDDWELVIESLYEAASDRLTRANAIGLDSTYGGILYDESHKIRAVADYLEFFLPGVDD